MRRLALSLVVVLLAAACGAGGATVTTAEPAGVQPDLQAFARALGQGTLCYASPEPTGPARLAEDQYTELVVSATLEAVTAGPVRSYGDSDEQWISVEAHVTQVHLGSVPDGANGIVYVAFQDPLFDPVTMDQLLPKGTPAVLYLGRWDPNLMHADPLLRNFDAGRPPGQPFYFANWIQRGMNMALDATTTVAARGFRWPLPLSEFLPDRTAWPSDEMRQELTVNEAMFDEFYATRMIDSVGDSTGSSSP